MKIIEGDCVEVMSGIPENSVDAIVTDPPYHLSFMGKKWDYAPTPNESQAQHEGWAREAFRVLKPGGHMLAFGGTRTVHRLTCAIEDAGFEIRDTVQWIYGSGFPKSLDVSKAIDKMAGAEREDTGELLPGHTNGRNRTFGTNGNIYGEAKEPKATNTLPATQAAQEWQGWGTALKPAHEPIICARKPLSESSVARNVLKWGTGAVNVDGCRVGIDEQERAVVDNRSGSYGPAKKGIYNDGIAGRREKGDPFKSHKQGRWPANLILSHSPDCRMLGERRVRAITGTAQGKMAGKNTDVYGTFGGSDRVKEATGYADPDGMETVEAWECVDGCPVKQLDEQSGPRVSSWGGPKKHKSEGGGYTNGDISGPVDHDRFKDGTNVSRFFYVAKASRRERNAGLEGMPEKLAPVRSEKSKADATRMGANAQEGTRPITKAQNNHPTVKPIALMRYLVRLITPPGGTVMDPFCGSGSTLCAAVLEGFDAIGIEMDSEYAEIARRRVAHHEDTMAEQAEGVLF